MPAPPDHHKRLASGVAQAEPALLDRLLIHDAPARQFDQRQFVLVVTAAAKDEGMLVIGERQDIQWQVRQGDLPSGWRDRRTVQQAEPLRRAGARRFVLGPESAR